MKQFRTVVLLTVTLPALVLAVAKSKKSDVSAAFANAHYVYVQAEDGDIMRPGLYPADHDAITDMQKAVQDWNRYVVTTDRDHADLVFMVRKGRLAGTQMHGGVAVPPGPSGGSIPNANRGQPGDQGMDTAGVQGEIGPSDDLLRVFWVKPDHKLAGPIWSREMKDGLDSPAVLLLRQLKDAVEAAYPPPQAAKQPAL